jgi:hypothetical protein
MRPITINLFSTKLSVPRYINMADLSDGAMMNVLRKLFWKINKERLKKSMLKYYRIIVNP